MQVIVRKALTFTRSGIAGEEHKTLAMGAGIQNVPDWIGQTDTFRHAVKDGSIVRIGILSEEPTVSPAKPVANTAALGLGQEPTPNAAPQRPVPPTVEAVMASGYSQAVAERIAAQEKAKFDAGVFPYGDKFEAPAPAARRRASKAEAASQEPAPAAQDDAPSDDPATGGEGSEEGEGDGENKE